MRCLVVYFSNGNNTRIVGNEIARQMRADICEIRPIVAYPKDYQKLMTKGITDVKKGNKPEIEDITIDFSKYDTIFIGTPNWLDTYAPPVATFLEKYYLENKIIVPFLTHNKGGKGHVAEDIREAYPKCRVIEAISIYGDGGETLVRDVEREIARKNVHNLNLIVK